MLTNLKRVFHLALTDFYRNKGISLAAIVVLTITIILVTGLFFIHGASNFLILTVKDKIDITAYFKADTLEQDILNARDEILKDVPSIKSVEYVSREEALENFTKKHANEPIFSRALLEIGGNPFLPSLNIATNEDPGQYEHISKVLQGEKFSTLIEKVDFSQKKDTIEKVFSITSNINKVGWALGGILIFVVILVVFNTIKLVIQSSKEEINTMRIVGASNWFIRAPFIIEGGIFGFIAFLFCLCATFMLVYFLSPGAKVLMPGFNLLDYFLSNFWLIILIQFAFGVGLGVLSSFIVVRRYLK